MPKKITQIAIGGDRVIALCGDGTLWTLDMIDMSQPMRWEDLPRIPDKVEKDEPNGKVEG
jgi:hypothetical protein